MLSPACCPQPLQWLHRKAREPGPGASPSLWCDLAQSPSLPGSIPHLEPRGWAVAWKAPASSDIYYFRIPQPLAVFLPALLEPVTGPVPPRWGPCRCLPSPGACPVLSAQPHQLPLAGWWEAGRKRGCRKTAAPSLYAEASANPKFPGWDFPLETARQ